jgi:hypothetical protein
LLDKGFHNLTILPLFGHLPWDAVKCFYLMEEMPGASEVHGYSRSIGCCYYFGVSNRSTGLYYCTYACL